MQVSPLPSAAPPAAQRADRQALPLDSGFDSVYDAQDDRLPERPDAAPRRDDRPSAADRHRDPNAHSEAADESAQAAPGVGDSGAVESLPDGGPLEPELGGPETDGMQSTDDLDAPLVEEPEAASRTSDQVAIAAPENSARATLVASGAGAEQSDARLVAEVAAGARTAAPETAPESVTGASTRVASTELAGQAAASAEGAKVRPLEADTVVVRRIRSATADSADPDAATASDAASGPDWVAAARDPQTAAPKAGATLVSGALAQVTGDAQMPATADPASSEVGLVEARSSGHVARADATIHHEAPRPAMQQVADAARALRDGPVELTLKPEELGKVRMTMTAGPDGTMSMSLHAERPETLDLLRRNIGDLARELQDMGFSNLNFSFAQDRAPAGQHHGEGRGDRETDERPVASIPLVGPSLAARPAMAPVSGGLDLRL